MAVAVLRIDVDRSKLYCMVQELYRLIKRNHAELLFDSDRTRSRLVVCCCCTLDLNQFDEISNTVIILICSDRIKTYLITIWTIRLVSLKRERKLRVHCWCACWQLVLPVYQHVGRLKLDCWVCMILPRILRK